MMARVRICVGWILAYLRRSPLCNLMCHDRVCRSWVVKMLLASGLLPYAILLACGGLLPHTLLLGRCFPYRSRECHGVFLDDISIGKVVLTSAGMPYQKSETAEVSFSGLKNIFLHVLRMVRLSCCSLITEAWTPP